MSEPQRAERGADRHGDEADRDVEEEAGGEQRRPLSSVAMIDGTPGAAARCDADRDDDVASRARVAAGIGRQPAQPLCRAEPERQEDRKIAAIRDHAGA